MKIDEREFFSTHRFLPNYSYYRINEKGDLELYSEKILFVPYGEDPSKKENLIEGYKRITISPVFEIRSEWVECDLETWYYEDEAYLWSSINKSGVLIDIADIDISKPNGSMLINGERYLNL